MRSLRNLKFGIESGFQTKSASETIRIGRSIGGRLLPGDVVALVGELGAGKTHFIKGLAAGAGLGIRLISQAPLLP